LLQLILGHIRPASGIVTWNGRPIHSLFRRRTFRVTHPIGLVLQNAALAFNPRWTVRDCLIEPSPKSDPSANVRIAEHMDALQLSTELLERRSDQLSGGQLQRMQLIRAVLARPHLLLFDEPISQLDGRTKEIVTTWLNVQIRLMNSTAVIVSHDEQWLRTFVDHVLDIHQT
jgi:ABC-type dipeptide/oligopeptide/nickel transport system ATPase subunit